MTSRLTKPGILILAVGIAIAFVAGLPTPSVAAHATQVRSTPEGGAVVENAPDRIIVWYSEPLEEQFSSISVLDPSGTNFELGQATIDPTEPRALSIASPELPDGIYVVTWKVLSAVDGHVTAGSFSFGVGDTALLPPSQVTNEQPLLQSAAEPWIRWILFAGILIIFGTLLFEMVATRALSEANRRDLLPSLPKLTLIITPLLILAQLVRLLTQLNSLFETALFEISPTQFLSVFSSSWGTNWLAVTGLTIVLLLTALPRLRNKQPFTNSTFGLIALFAVAGLVGFNSLASHAAALDEQLRTQAIINDIIHTAAAAVWVGGVVYIMLLLIKPKLARSSSMKLSPYQLNDILVKFGPMAIISAGALVTSGILSSILQVQFREALMTPYGMVLIAKVATVVLLIAIALVNSTIIKPRLLKKLAPRWFAVTLGIELTVMALVILAAGWLTSIEPAGQYATSRGLVGQSGATYSEQVQGARLLNINAEIEPATIGPNNITVNLTDQQDNPFANALDVRFLVQALDYDLAETDFSLIQTSPGVWTTENYPINLNGQYEARLRVIRSDGADAIAAFRFNTTPSILGNTVADNNIINLIWLLLGGELIIIALLILITLVLPHKRAALRQYQPLGASAILIVAGLVLALNVVTARVGLPQSEQNPFPLTAESAELGQATYINHCSSCHGVAGKGDGPLVNTLAVAPADLIIHVPLHTDPDLFGIINDGFPDSGMPAFEDLISDEQKWHLINYMRRLIQDNS